MPSVRTAIRPRAAARRSIKAEWSAELLAQISSECPVWRVQMSGYGREQGREAWESHTQYKTVWVDLGEPIAAAR